jgi:hypothetical protein
MSNEEFNNQRILLLEQQVAMLTTLVRNLADTSMQGGIGLLRLILATAGENDQLLMLLAKALPEEDQKAFDFVLTRLRAQRDGRQAQVEDIPLLPLPAVPPMPPPPAPPG